MALQPLPAEIFAKIFFFLSLLGRRVTLEAEITHFLTLRGPFTSRPTALEDPSFSSNR
jgi:hypothetical protein